MLESLAQESGLTTPALARCRSCAALRRATDRFSFELSRCATRSFFPAVERIAKHSRYRVLPAQKMHLEAVSLLFCPRSRVDATDVWFRIRIRSPSHEPCLTTTSNNAGINESRFFYRITAFFPAAANPSRATSFHIPQPAIGRNTDAGKTETR